MGDVSVRPNGTLIQRGFVLQGPISGDLDSDADDAVVVTGSLILDVAGSGGAQGSLTITACHDDLGCGTFQGAFNGKFSAGLFGDVLRMRGTGGAFVGRILTGTFQEAGPPPGENVYTIAATIQ